MNGHTWQLRLQICCLALCWRRVCWNFYHRTLNCPDCFGTKVGPWPPGIWPSVSPGFGQRAYSWRRCDQCIIPYFRFHKKFSLYSELSNISTGTLINSGKKILAEYNFSTKYDSKPFLSSSKDLQLAKMIIYNFSCS